MKQKTQSQLVAIAWKAMKLSVVGFAGLSLLTTSAVAQESKSTFTPGSTFSPSNGGRVWVPPTTEVPSSKEEEPQASGSDWSPPETPVLVSEPEPAVKPDPVKPDPVKPDPVKPDPVEPEPVKPEPVKPEPVEPASVQLAPASESEPAVIVESVQPKAAAQEADSVVESLLPPAPPSIPNSATTPPMAELPSSASSTSSNSSDAFPTLQPLEVNGDSGQSVITEDFDLQDSFDSQPDIESQTDELQLQFDESAAVSSAGIATNSVVDGTHLRTPVRNILRGAETRLAGNDGVHAVGQLTFLSLSRDYRGKGRVLSNGAPNVLANGPDESDFTGVDLSYGQRGAGGRGWEMRYFGFNPDQATDVAGSNPTLVWGGIAPPLNDPATWGGAIPAGVPETYGLSGIGFGTVSMASLFDGAGNHRVSRDSEFGSFEFNFLRASAGGNRLTCGNAMVEFFGGLRGVSFKETTTFTARALQSPSLSSAFYASEVQNSLFGLQIGGRIERQRKNGWSTSFGSRVGIYNNRVENRQHAQYQFADGSTAVPQVLFGSEAGREFDYEGKDNELAFLGELDFGLIYQFRPKTRARFGYRGIAVTNIADSAGQFEDNLYDGEIVAEPKAWGDLIVGGFYFGVDHAF